MAERRFELLTASLPNREEVVIEIWHVDLGRGPRQLLAEMRFESEAEGPRVLLFPPAGGEAWDFDLFELRRVVFDAWDRFSTTFEPELNAIAQRDVENDESHH